MFDIFIICILCGILAFLVYLAHKAGYKDGFADAMCYKRDDLERIVFKPYVEEIKYGKKKNRKKGK